MKKIYYGIIGIAAIILILILANISGLLSVSSGTPLLYPLYASVCCEATGPEDWKSKTFFYDDYPEIAIVCPSTTTQCRVKDEPSFQCGSLQSGYYKIILKEPTGAIREFDSYTSTGTLPLKEAPSDQKQISALGSMNWDLECCFGFICKDAKATIYWDVINTKLYVNPAMEGRYDIPNTDLCQWNQELIKQYKDNLPAQLAEEAIEIIEDLSGKSISAPKSTKGTVNEMGQKLAVGECYLGVDKWVELPSAFNINPFGQFQNEDVICSLSKGIIKVEEIKTVGGQSYLVPTKRMPLPDKFCCDHQFCKQTYGADYNCVSYSCQKSEGSCNSDLDCQPQGGIKIDANCYREENTMNFFKWGSECTNNKCTSPNKESVKCCPGYCTTVGKWCDFEKGCMDPLPQPQPCPPGKCCNEGNIANYIPKECGEGLKCCADANGFGNCATNCDGEVGECSCWIPWPKALGGGCVIPNLWCKLDHWVKSKILFVSILIGILGGIAALIYSNKIIIEQDIEDTPRWILNIIIAIIAGLIVWWVTYNLWWVGVIILIVMIILKWVTSSLP